jgi:hypothetical protein
MPEGDWIFSRNGFWRSKAIVRRYEDGPEVASAGTRGFTKGAIELADGGQYHARLNFWQTKLELRSTDGTLLLSMHRSATFRFVADVKLEPAIRSSGVPAWLSSFCWYLWIGWHQDAADASMTIAVASAVHSIASA